MTAPPEGNRTPQISLGYDDYVPERDVRSRWLLPGYWLGICVAGCGWGIIMTLYLMIFDRENSFGAAEGFIIGIGAAILALLPATLFLGVAIWARTKVVREIRFARFRAAFLSGLPAGLYPFTMSRMLGVPDDDMLWLFVGGLIWIAVYCTLSSFWLCYRSALRD